MWRHALGLDFWPLTWLGFRTANVRKCVKTHEIRLASCFQVPFKHLPTHREDIFGGSLRFTVTKEAVFFEFQRSCRPPISWFGLEDFPRICSGQVSRR